MSNYSTIPQGAKVDNITTNLNSSGQIQVIKTYTYHYENEFTGGTQIFNGTASRITTITAGTLATGTELIIKVNLTIDPANFGTGQSISFYKYIKVNGINLVQEYIMAKGGDGTQEKILIFRYTTTPTDATQDLIINTGTILNTANGGPLYLREDRVNIFGTLK